MTPVAVQVVLTEPRTSLTAGLGAAALLFLPDVLRQLPVRRDPVVAHHLLVRAAGFVTSGAVQIALVGHLAARLDAASPVPTRSPVGRGSVALLGAAVRRDPWRVARGLVGYGALGGLITVPFSLRLFGPRLLTGPLPRPTLGRLCAAEVTNALATTVSAPLFAVHALACADRLVPPSSGASEPRRAPVIIRL